MKTMIDQMLKAYDAQTIYDQKNAMKEVMQEIKEKKPSQLRKALFVN